MFVAQRDRRFQDKPAAMQRAGRATSGFRIGLSTALQSEARRHGETDPETSSSATGALHRGWMNLKSAITGGDEHAILAECERGEDSAVEEYKKAMADGLSPSAQEIVSRQFAEIKAAHDRIKSLRDAAKN